MDAATLADGGAELCAQASECDDGLYCNGAETCDPGGTGADARGCVPGPQPCDVATETCDEAASACSLDECTDGGDEDGDGDMRIACGGSDCDDTNDMIYGTAQEICDGAGVDEDCNPETIRDASVGSTDGDEDMDGFISDECSNVRADGTLNEGDDCDDSRSGTNPGASDVCGGGDQDCDGAVDEEPSILYYFDMDGDGYGVNTADSNVLACSPPSASYTLLEGDCDETRPNVHPGLPEMCNGLDDDCDGSTDPGCSCLEGSPQTCGPPTEVGECAQSTRLCTAAGEWPTSCPGAVYPATEVCGGGDEDCDGTTDESGASDAPLFYLDADRDGYGDPASPMRVCATRLGELAQPHVSNNGDCDDSRDTFSPTAIESCDGFDENCNGIVDDVPGGCDCTEGETQPCGPPEAGVGACRNGTQTCSSGRWGACVGAVTPTTEVCDGSTDEDCDGMVDEPGAVGETLFYRDADSDGFGDISTTALACGAPAGYVTDNTDCIDSNDDAHPGQTSHFRTPACVNGLSPSYGHPTGGGTTWHCGFTPVTEADWDYNCNGIASFDLVFCSFGCPATTGAAFSLSYTYEDCGQDLPHQTCRILSGGSCGADPASTFTDTAGCI